VPVFGHLIRPTTCLRQKECISKPPSVP
jgi:hypothetical protein